MKKLLLTLGSTASVVAPLATVVACGSEDSYFSGMGIYDSDSKVLTITGMEWKSLDDIDLATTTDEEYVGFMDGFAKLLKNEEYKDAASITTVSTALNIPLWDSFTYDGPDSPATLGDVTSHDWQGTTGDLALTADQTMAEAVFLQLDPFASGNVDESKVIADLEALNVTSTLADSSKTGMDATDADEALSEFGLDATEFAKITDVLGTDWELVRLDSFFTSESGISIYFEHKDETGNVHDTHVPVTWTTA